MPDDVLKPYLAYSAGCHLLLTAGLLLLLPKASSKPGQVYHVMAMSAAPGILNRTPGPDAPAAKAPPSRDLNPQKAQPAPKPAPQKNPDAFETSAKSPSRPLPKPSFLRAPEPGELPKKEEPAWAPAPSEAETLSGARPAEAGGKGGGGEGASLAAVDMPDFPYPWYVTQLRSAVWNRWTARLLSGTGNCIVRFTILKNGRAVDIRIEATSGERGFDYAALSAVQDAAPFAPLPPGFPDDFLNIHFEFKS